MRRILGSLLAALVGLAAVAAGAAPPAAAGGDPVEQSRTFLFCGSFNWVVPADVASIVVDLHGGHGGAGNGDGQGNSAPGGPGGRGFATIPVTGGETLSLEIGCDGTDAVSGQASTGGAGYGDGGDGGWDNSSLPPDPPPLGVNPGGGGGGGTALLRGSTPLLVVGGGGGGGADCCNDPDGDPIGAMTAVGGAGGGPNSLGGDGVAQTSGCAGAGAAPAAPGAGGVVPSGTNGSPGVGSDGGDGAVDLPNPQGGYTGGGGGGGGYFGGGGAGAFGNSVCAGGGGGSGYAHPSVTGIGGGPSTQPGEGSATITFSSAVVSPGPANDSYRSAQDLPTGSGAVNGTIVGATVDPDEPDHAGAAPEHSVWYRLSTSGPSRLRLDTQGSAVDTRLAVYRGDPLARTFTLVAQNDDASGASTASEVTFTADGGAYYIAVDGKGGATGAISLAWLTDTTRPDARVRVAGNPTLLGDDVYGNAVPGQAVVRSTPAGRTAAFVVSVQNDSAFPERLRLSGPAERDGFVVTYRSPGGTDVSNRVGAGTFRTPLLAPGATYDLRATVAVPARTRAGVARAFIVTANGTVPGLFPAPDAVRFTARAT